jgi:hypothetical protein
MLYSIGVANPGALAVDAGTLAVRAVLPPGAALFVDTAAGDPVAFVDGAPASGLSFDYASAVRFSNRPGGGPPFDYLPAPDAEGFDAAVTGFRVAPQGALAPTTPGGTPSFTLRYRVRIP